MGICGLFGAYMRCELIKRGRNCGIKGVLYSLYELVVIKSSASPSCTLVSPFWGPCGAKISNQKTSQFWKKEPLHKSAFHPMHAYEYPFATFFFLGSKVKRKMI
jgi:hypothetical protein